MEVKLLIMKKIGEGIQLHCKFNFYETLLNHVYVLVSLFVNYAFLKINYVILHEHSKLFFPWSKYLFAQPAKTYSNIPAE